MFINGNMGRYVYDINNINAKNAVTLQIINEFWSHVDLFHYS